MTKKEMFAMAINVISETTAPEKEELIAGLEHELELLASRKSSKTLTKAQKENENIMNQILVNLANINTPVTVTELIEKGEDMNYSNQKLSALLKKLVDAGKVVKTIEGKKAMFSIA